MKTIETTIEKTRPMLAAVRLAEVNGYVRSPELPIKRDHIGTTHKTNLWYTLLEIKEWLYSNYSIHVWESVNGSFEFTPYYRDLRKPDNAKVAMLPYCMKEEAFARGLMEAIKQINN